MYRQLLQTPCKPHLRLSRKYTSTPAQRAVKDMPWWSEEDMKGNKMVVSYGDLMKRLWIGGGGYSGYGGDDPVIPNAPFWVDRMGFQLPDPLTDFRGGGVLSLSMMVFIVEQHSEVMERYISGDASDLPFALTCVNCTDMLAKVCMLESKVESIDVLLSQKPFWRCFSSPHSLLQLQLLSMQFVADVHNEQTEEVTGGGTEGGGGALINFEEILDIVKERIEGVLDHGPKDYTELVSISAIQRNKHILKHKARVKEAKNDFRNRVTTYQKPGTGTTPNSDDEKDLESGDGEDKKVNR